MTSNDSLGQRESKLWIFEMNTPLQEAEFYRRVAYYRYHAEFDVN